MCVCVSKPFPMEKNVILLCLKVNITNIRLLLSLNITITTSTIVTTTSSTTTPTFFPATTHTTKVIVIFPSTATSNLANIMILTIYLHHNIAILIGLRLNGFNPLNREFVFVYTQSLRNSSN